MSDPSPESELHTLAPLLDRLASPPADPRHMAHLIDLLGAETDALHTPALATDPPPDPEWRLFLALCGGGAVVVALLYLALTLALPDDLITWLGLAAIGAGLLGLGLLGRVLWQRRIA